VADNDVDSKVALKGARQFSSDADRVAKDTQKLGDKARSTGAGLKGAGDQSDRAHRAFSRLGVGSRGLTGSLGVLTRGAGGAVVGLGSLIAVGAGIKTAFSEATEAAKVGAQTNAVLKSTGSVAGVSAAHVGALAQSISNYAGIDDEAIQSGENLLLTFTNIRNGVGKNNKIFDQATSIVTDMSVALGQDMKSSAIQVGKALNDPVKGITALQRVGVSFTADQKKQITALAESGHRMEAQKLILRELNKEFAGSAKAQAQPLDKVKVALGNVAEAAGGLLLPVMNKLATPTANFINGITQGTGAGGRFAARVRSLARDLGDLARKGWAVATRAAAGFMDMIRPATPFLKNVLLPVLKGIAVGALGLLIGAFKAAVPLLRLFFQGLGAIGRLLKPYKSQIVAITVATIAMVAAFKAVRVGQAAFLAVGLGISAVRNACILTRIQLAALKVQEIAVAVASKAMAAAQWLVNAALSANPIGAVVVALAALSAGLVTAYHRVRWFHNAVDSAFGFIKSHWPLLVGIMTGPIGLAVAGMTKALGRIVAFVKRIPSAFGAAGRSAGGAIVRGIVAGITAAPRAILDAIQSIIPDKLRGVIGGIVGGVGDVAGDVTGAIGGLFGGHARGGVVGPIERLSLVGEQGPELVSLPSGTRVTPAPETRGLLRQALQTAASASGAVAGGMHLTLEVPVSLDGKVIARNTLHHFHDMHARA
jgi:hypothetical protein